MKNIINYNIIIKTQEIQIVITALWVCNIDAFMSTFQFLLVMLPT